MLFELLPILGTAVLCAFNLAAELYRSPFNIHSCDPSGMVKYCVMAFAGYLAWSMPSLSSAA